MSAADRRRMLQELLAESPDDPELHYALAMEEVSAGDHEAAVARFRTLIASHNHVPAYLMAAQSLLKLGRTPEAATILRDGIDAARRQNNLHALGEMQGLLATLE